MSTKEKANLARIRDNQRRSRARRKEYLQELEARLRRCELQGVEASSEIQIAARRVADENRSLRGLLAQHGVSEESIEHHLKSSSTSDTVAAQHGGSSAAVQALEQLLQARKPWCGDDNNNSMSATGNMVVGSLGSSGSGSTVQSPWDSMFTPPPGESQRSDTLYSSGNVANSTQPFMTPSTSTASRTSSVVSTQNSRSISSHYQMASVQMPRNPGHRPVSTRNQQMLEFVDSQISLATQRHPQSTSDAQRHLQPQPPSDQRSSVYMPVHETNMNSCDYATEIITSMAGVDPSLVRADLGCLDPSQECEVDNQLVFDIMDQYTGSI